MKLSLSHNSCVQITFLQLLFTQNVINCQKFDKCDFSYYRCLNNKGDCTHYETECAQSCDSDIECLEFKCCRDKYCLSTQDCPTEITYSSQPSILSLVISVPIIVFAVIICVCFFWRPIGQCLGSIQLRRANSSQNIQVHQGRRVQNLQIQNPGNVILERSSDRNPFEEQQNMVQQQNNPLIVQLGEFKIGQSSEIPINMVYLPDPGFDNVNNSNNNQSLVVNPIQDFNARQVIDENKILPINLEDSYL